MKRTIIAAYILLILILGVLILNSQGLSEIKAQSILSSVESMNGPQITAGFMPNLQTVNLGEKVTFTIEITNSGPVDLASVSVTGSPVAACNKNDLGSLVVGQTISYTCERTNVTQNFINEIEVIGETADEVATKRKVGAFVKVRKTVLAIEKRPITQIVNRGGTARFTIVLFNLSADTFLTDVTVDDSIADDCDRNPAIPINLAPGESRDYLCALPNVQLPVTTIATVQGRNPANNEIFTDNFVAWVDMRGITATLTSEPDAVTEPGGLVTFTVDLVNPGSFPVILTTLTTDRFGNLLSETNPQIDPATNTCLSPPGGLPTIQPYGGRYSCSFVAAASGRPPEFVVNLTARARDAANVEVTATTSATITVINLPAEISLTVSADPPFIQPPGRLVTFNVRVQNTSAADNVTITELTDSLLGSLNGRGSCQTPQLIATGNGYECAYTDNIQGQAGEEKSRTVSAVGVDDNITPGEVTASATVTVGITEQATRYAFMPSVANDLVGKRCGDPYPMTLDRQYYFIPPLPWLPQVNEGSFFRYTLTQTSNVRIELTDFKPVEGQLIVWTNGCGSLVRNTNTAMNKQLDIGVQTSGTYIIQLINDGPRNTKDVYGIVVKTN